MKLIQNFKKSSLTILLTSLIGTSAMAGDDIVVDGGFETGFPNTAWTPASTFDGFPGFPICGANDGCPVAPSDIGMSGLWLVWIGGIGTGVTSTVEQTLTIPSSATDLTISILRGVCDDASDTLEISIDGNIIGSVICDDTDAAPVLHTFPVAPYNDDASHSLVIGGTVGGTNGAHSNFFVDDVAIEEALPVELMNFSVE